MPTCLNCGQRYEQDECPHCAKHEDARRADLSLIKLCNVGDEISASILADRLTQEGIPFIKKYPGSGELMRVYAGFSPFGADFFVAEDDIEAARAIADSDFDPDELERQAMEAGDDQQ